MQKYVIILLCIVFIWSLYWCENTTKTNNTTISHKNCISNWGVVISWLWNGLSWEELQKALQKWNLEISHPAKCPLGKNKIGTISNRDNDVMEEICCE